MKSGPSKQFLCKYKIDGHSHPCNWFNAILPLMPKDNLESIEDIDVNGDGRTKFAVSNWTAYTNLKAKLSNAREYGYPFARRWSELTTDEVYQFLGAIILDGVNPSP